MHPSHFRIDLGKGTIVVTEPAPQFHTVAVAVSFRVTAPPMSGAL